MVVLTIRLIFIITGILLFILNILFYVKKKNYEDVALIWVLGSIAFVIFGVLPFWDYSLGEIGIKVLIPLSSALSIGSIILFLVSSTLSVLRKRTQELAMQVSLLNQENEAILRKICKLEGKL